MASHFRFFNFHLWFFIFILFVELFLLLETLGIWSSLWSWKILHFFHVLVRFTLSYFIAKIRFEYIYRLFSVKFTSLMINVSRFRLNFILIFSLGSKRVTKGVRVLWITLFLFVYEWILSIWISRFLKSCESWLWILLRLSKMSFWNIALKIILRTPLIVCVFFCRNRFKVVNFLLILSILGLILLK